jgi:hypothetical protein
MNLVEVTIPYGYANVEFENTEEGEVDEASKIKFKKNSLEIALNKKREKYNMINQMPESL